MGAAWGFTRAAFVQIYTDCDCITTAYMPDNPQIRMWAIVIKERKGEIA